MENSIAAVRTEQRGQAEARLWQAVVVHAIQEWISGPLRRQREAEQYLFNDNSDFRLVCASAGMDAGSLRMRLVLQRKQLATHAGSQIAA